ncbi:hypothetical protein [Streptomyces fractus]|uniref:hypothetical protein n=1 Tax=Streptomyces fractus TaxID=641806 RepID=UPI003CF9C187
MPQTRDLITKAESAVRKASERTAHPDDIARAQATTNLALAQSNSDLAAAITALTGLARDVSKPNSTILKAIGDVSKALATIAKT